MGIAMDHTEDSIADADEPPDDRRHNGDLVSSPPRFQSTFIKPEPRIQPRRESLLTLQLHSDPEHSDGDGAIAALRAFSTQSTESTRSTASTAELTSDDGHSVPSPSISPPSSTIAVSTALPHAVKPLAKEPIIVEHVETPIAVHPETTSEKVVEAGLGRKRCISFACGRKTQPAAVPQQPPPPVVDVHPKTDASPPKRKCMLKFVCPNRPDAAGKSHKATTEAKPSVTVPSPERKPSTTVQPVVTRTNRAPESPGSQSSPRTIRKHNANGSISTVVSASPTQHRIRKVADDSDSSTEATRFHEFASSDDEPEEWVQEATCYRRRLTVDDTLQKEHVIRKACEEAEEEVVEEEEEKEALAEEDDLELDDEDDSDLNEEDDLDLEDAATIGDARQVDEIDSDEGFHTDDEHGFAESDSEGEDSDYDWWRPGRSSTAATSIEHMERLWTQAQRNDTAPPSSLGSVSSGHHSPRTSAARLKPQRNHHPTALPIHNRAVTPDLPDSTDFVCGTLDEDRPLEQAYLNNLKQREAAKHKTRPQDIDPTFPTSDPELDEEDDEDLEDPAESETDGLMHGDLDELDDRVAAKRRPSPRPLTRNNTNRSPPPHARLRSPAPVSRRCNARSPPPPRRNTARSPPPRKLFGHSPKRMRSPAPGVRMTSPPNTRDTSPSGIRIPIVGPSHGLAARPQPTHTSSLPRKGSFLFKKPNSPRLGDIHGGSDLVRATTAGDLPRRGAIDIVKGLEKKRQRRKEKLYQKACAKAATKGEKVYKVKPGKGAERMREVGLELQKHHGKGEHILSL